MKIEQDATIAIQIAKALQGHEGPLTLNVNLNANGNQELNVAITDSNGVALPVEDQALLAFIETFPPPRLRNFIEHIKYIAAQKFGCNKRKSSEWLGIGLRTMYHFNEDCDGILGYGSGGKRSMQSQYSRDEIVEALGKVDWKLGWAAVDLKMGANRLRRICNEMGIIPPWGSWRRQSKQKQIEFKEKYA